MRFEPADPKKLIKALTVLGHYVQIDHFRCLDNAFVGDEDDMRDFEDDGYPAGAMECATKPRYKAAFEDGMVFGRYDSGKFFSVNPENYLFEFDNVVNPCGGFTRVIIGTPDGESYIGKRNFGKKERFNKKHGLVGALMRAFIMMEQAKMELEAVSH